MNPEGNAVDRLRRLFFYQSEHHAKMWRNKDGAVGYSPACSRRFSELCNAQGHRCNSCPHREFKPLTNERLRDHLQGRITLGAYQLRSDGTAGWLCWDIDADEGSQQARDNVKRMTRLMIDKMRQIGIPVYPEDSGNKGIHLWMFTPEGAPAASLRALGDWVVNAIQEQEGQYYGIHVEVFPKQTALRSGELGNLVKVPLSLHLKTGRPCLFLDSASLEHIGQTSEDQYAYLSSIETVTAEQIQDAIADWLPDDAMLQPTRPQDSTGRSGQHGRLARETIDFREHGADIGTRNDRLFKAAADLAGNGYSKDEIVAQVMEPALQSGLDSSEIRRTVVSAVSKPRTPSVPAIEVGSRQDSMLTDLRNGIRFVKQHGPNLRFCPGLGGWLVWDGMRWVADDTGQVMRWAKETVLSLYELAPEQPDDSRADFVKEIARLESLRRLEAMVRAAESESDVQVRVTDFDSDPWLLNVENGTLDLRTGTLREHRREDMITKLASVSYQPDVTDTIFEQYLSQATQGDAEFADYLQKAAGYSLTGRTDAESVFLVLGPGATGKSTLIEALLATLGDYAVKTSFDTFLLQRNVGAPRPDLVAMRGARMVAATEPERGRRLAAGLIKELSGGDTISVRTLYRAPISFQPTFKLWLGTNAAPEMDDDDTGLWRRIVRLPFEHVIPETERKPEIKAHLVSPEGRQAVLAWAVDGVLKWQREPLRPPEVLRRATAELKREFDPLAAFIEEQCLVRADLCVEAGSLRQAYEEWAKTYGAKPLNDREWGRRLIDMGLMRDRQSSMGVRRTSWHGIALLTTQKEGSQGTDDLPF